MFGREIIYCVRPYHIFKYIWMTPHSFSYTSLCLTPSNRLFSLGLVSFIGMWLSAVFFRDSHLNTEFKRDRDTHIILA